MVTLSTSGIGGYNILRAPSYFLVVFHAQVCFMLIVDDDDDCFYIVLFSALEQTRCARM